MADRILLESGSPDGYLLEDGSGVILNEVNASFLTQEAFRFYEDGTESGSVASAAQDTNITRNPASAPKVLLRIRLANSGGDQASTTFGLFYSKNGGAYNLIEVLSTGNVDPSTSSGMSDGDATTNRLTGGSGTFESGKVSASGSDTQINAGVTGGNYTEHLFALNLVAADLTTSDTLDFQLRKGGLSLDAYSVTPRITVGAGGPAAYTLTCSPGSFALSGTATSLKRALKATAASGSFTLTGTAAALRKGYKLTVTPGAFSLSGTAVTLRRTYVMPAASGAFTLTGTAATLKRGLKLTAAAGAFTLSGTAVSLRIARKITAASGAFALSGTAVSLKAGRSLTASAGSFTLSGQVANLKRGLRLSAASGSFALSGTAAALLFGNSMIASAGAFSLAGASTSLLAGRRLQLASGAFALTGTAATLSKGGSGLSYSMPAGAGAFALTGQVAALRRGFRMIAGAGAYSLTGSALTLSVRRNFDPADAPPSASLDIVTPLGSAVLVLNNRPVDAAAAVPAAPPLVQLES